MKTTGTITTIAVPGIATNTGNNPFSASGKNSTEISVNLTNNTTIPNDAIISHIATVATQSPHQSNAKHHIKPASSSTWFESLILTSSSGRGSYLYLSVNDNIAVKQIWSFRYNAALMSSSTMSNVKLEIKYRYDDTLLVYK
jgi:hypothetical protein